MVTHQKLKKYVFFFILCIMVCVVHFCMHSLMHKIKEKKNMFEKKSICVGHHVRKQLYFNYYNFDDTKMFNPNDIDTKLHKFINNEYRVLIITKAGAEGVDTVNCQNIILFDSQWNDTTSEQIIARDIRFKSHNGLPEKERYVNVIRVKFCFPNGKKNLMI